MIVSGIDKHLDKKLWHPGSLANLPNPLDPLQPDVSAVSHGIPIKTFFDSFDEIAKRPRSMSGDPLTLKLKENWDQEDNFAELLPKHYQDLMCHLPLQEYTVREGILNLASRLPDCFVRLDLGPRLWGGYSQSTFNLQYNVSGMIHVMFHVYPDFKEDILDSLKHIGCDEDSLELAQKEPKNVGAVWHIFHPKDMEKSREFIHKNVQCKKIKFNKDPLWLGTIPYMNLQLLKKLDSDFGIRSWTVVQMQGDGIFIPPGAPYQVKILNASMFVQTDFISPEHIDLTMKVSCPDYHQVKNIVFHACKDALSVLEMFPKSFGKQE